MLNETPLPTPLYLCTHTNYLVMLKETKLSAKTRSLKQKQLSVRIKVRVDSKSLVSIGLYSIGRATTHSPSRWRQEAELAWARSKYSGVQGCLQWTRWASTRDLSV